MPIYTQPNIPLYVYDYLLDSNHILYTDKFDETQITEKEINMIQNSVHMNYITLRCNTLHVRALICISRAYIFYDNRKLKDIFINVIEVDEEYQNQQNFKKFIAIMENICIKNNRVLCITNVCSQRLIEIMNKNKDKYELKQYTDNDYICKATITKELLNSAPPINIF